MTTMSSLWKKKRNIFNRRYLISEHLTRFTQQFIFGMQQIHYQIGLLILYNGPKNSELQPDLATIYPRIAGVIPSHTSIN